MSALSLLVLAFPALDIPSPLAATAALAALVVLAVAVLESTSWLVSYTGIVASYAAIAAGSGWARRIVRAAETAQDNSQLLPYLRERECSVVLGALIRFSLALDEVRRHIVPPMIYSATDRAVVRMAEHGRAWRFTRACAEALGGVVVWTSAWRDWWTARPRFGIAHGEATQRLGDFGQAPAAQPVAASPTVSSDWIAIFAGARNREVPGVN